MSLQRIEGQFNFRDGDRMVEIAEQNGATPIGHTLVWHEQTPRWFFEGPDGQPASRELALARLRKHIATVVGHYKGRVKQWDVVNEAISDTPGEVLRQTPWLKAIGEDYIAEAFRAAHAADPNAILIYNDYNIERSYKRPKALQLLRSLLDQKVPVHAVGIQGHWRMDNPDFAEVEESIKQFAALGLKVMITELDIGVLPTQYQGANISTRETMTPEQEAVMNPYTKGLPDEVAQRHAERYRQAFEMFLRHKDVIGRVTLWGMHDGDSWFNNFPIRGRTDYPLLFDRQGKPKPAFFAVRNVAQATPVEQRRDEERERVPRLHLSRGVLLPLRLRRHAPMPTPCWRTSSSLPRQRLAASTSTSLETPSRAAGDQATASTQLCWRTGRRTSSAGTPATSGGALIPFRTCYGASRTANWMG
jgi:endo-1,4-beta-xylanase